MLEEELKENADILEMMVGSEGRTPTDVEVERVVERGAGMMSDALSCAERARLSSDEKIDSEIERLRVIHRQGVRMNEAVARASEMGIVGENDRVITGHEEIVSRLEKRVESLRLALALRCARRSRGWKQAEVARELEISEAYMSQLENAKCKAPSPRVMEGVNGFLEPTGKQVTRAKVEKREKPDTAREERSGKRSGEDVPLSGIWYEGKVKLYVFGEEQKVGVAMFDEETLSKGYLMRELLSASSELDDAELRMLIEIASRLTKSADTRGEDR